MNLGQREKIFISIGSLILFVTLFYILLVEPQLERSEKLKRLIPKKETQIQECQKIVAEYARLKKVLDDQKQKIQNRGSAPFMQSYLESESSALGLTIASMVPKSLDLNDMYREDRVEIKLERMKLDALVAFLHKIENSTNLLKIKNIRIKRRYDDHSVSDVTVTISTLVMKDNGT